MDTDDEFNYSSGMKEYYKSDETAEEYREAFASTGNYRHRLIANRECNAVKTLLTTVPHATVLDIPTGTGKLAPVFAQTDSEVLACDISENMLQHARVEYERQGVTAQFDICDAEKTTDTIGETFDVAVCLRLLHRVPTNKKFDILNELGAVADHVIASTGVETGYHRLRRQLRQRVLGGDRRNHCYETPEETREIFTSGFQIIDTERVLPLLSQERCYLLRSE